MKTTTRPIGSRWGLWMVLVLRCVTIDPRPAAATDRYSSDIHGHAEVLIGGRAMSLGAWSPVRRQFLIGGACGLGKRTSKLLLDAGFTFCFASHDGYPAKDGSGDVISLFAGAGGMWTSSSKPWRAYVGAGPEFAVATFDSIGGAQSESRGSIAGYTRGGVGWTTGSGWSVGVDARYTLGPRVTIQGRDRGVTGASVALSLLRVR